MSEFRPPLALTILVLALGGVGAGVPAVAAEGPWQTNAQSRVRLVSPWAEAPRPGEPPAANLYLGLELEIIPGWHVYWKNSGDAGFPPVLDFSPTPEVAEAELLWPAPERYELRGGLVAFGYEEHVIYPIRIRLAEDRIPPSSEALTLTADLDYLVCEVDCIPYAYRLVLEQPLVGSGAEPRPGPRAPDIERWRRRLPHPVAEMTGVATEGFVDLEDPGTPRLIVEVSGVSAGGEDTDPPQIFLEAHELFDTERPTWAATADGLRFTVPLTYRELLEVPPTEVEFAWTVTRLQPTSGGADDRHRREPLALEARRTVPVRAGADEDPEAGLEDDPAADSGRESSERADASSNRLLWAWVAGLLLALTPQLLALWGLRLEALGSSSTPARVRRGALATALGVVVGFGGLAFGLVRVRGLPAWGAQLQEPGLVTGLALGTLALALAAWGLLSRRGESEAPIRPEIPALAAGLLAASLALGWNVPGLSFRPSSALAAGLGAAVPYLLVAGAPELAFRMHRAAERFRLREALGFLALVGLLWLLYLLAGLLAAEVLALVELLLLTLALLAWGRTTVRSRWARGLLTVLLVAAAIYTVTLAG